MEWCKQCKDCKNVWNYCKKCYKIYGDFKCHLEHAKVKKSCFIFECLECEKNNLLEFLWEKFFTRIPNST